MQARTAAYTEVEVVGSGEQRRLVRLILVRKYNPGVRGTTEARGWYPEALVSYRDGQPDSGDREVAARYRRTAADNRRRAALIDHLLPPYPATLPEKPLPNVDARASLDSEIQELLSALAATLEPGRQEAADRIRTKAGADINRQLDLVASEMRPGGTLADLRAQRNRHRGLTAPVFYL